MRLRQGRHRPRNVYLQLDDSPDSDDVFLALFDDPDVAALAVRDLNENSAFFRRLEAIVIEGVIG